MSERKVGESERSEEGCSLRCVCISAGLQAIVQLRANVDQSGPEFIAGKPAAVYIRGEAKLLNHVPRKL